MKVRIDYIYSREFSRIMKLGTEIEDVIENDDCIIRMKLDGVGEIIDDYIEIDLDKVREIGEEIYNRTYKGEMQNKVYYIICVGELGYRIYYPESMMDLKGYKFSNTQEKISVREYLIKKLLE